MKNIIFTLLCIFGLLACSKPNQDISAQITKQFESSGSSAIDLRQVGPADWERLCAIGPYAFNNSVEKLLGFKWAALGLSSIGGNDSIYLLVFIKGKQVVAYTEHPRNKGDFYNLTPKCLAREVAVLKRKADSTGWVQLVYEP
jgi:hypothetical protein